MAIWREARSDLPLHLLGDRPADLVRGDLAFLEGGRWLQLVTTAPRFGGPPRHPDAFVAAYPTLSIGTTLFMGGGVMLMWGERLGFDRLFSEVVPGALVILGFAVAALSGCVYLFMRPAVLIPPPLRGATGALGTSQREPQP